MEKVVLPSLSSLLLDVGLGAGESLNIATGDLQHSEQMNQIFHDRSVIGLGETENFLPGSSLHCLLCS